MWNTTLSIAARRWWTASLNNMAAMGGTGLIVATSTSR
jgi:hypothetical protein